MMHVARIQIGFRLQALGIPSKPQILLIQALPFKIVDNVQSFDSSFDL
jgi:hypothetical protein